MTDGSGLDALARDGLFQLNVVLWSVQPAPPASEQCIVDPVLRGVGYSLDSLGRRLEPSASLRGNLSSKLAITGRAEPDVLLAAPGSSPWPILECKASSFGVESSTAVQARKLLAIGTNLAGSLLLPLDQWKPGFVAYVVAQTTADVMEATLAALRSELETAGVPCAEAGVLGIQIDDEGTWIAPGQRPWPEPAASALGERALVLPIDMGQDPRPLYILPYDPSLAEHQSAENREHGLRVLLLRTATEAASRVGTTEAPARVILMMTDLLRAATYGVFDHWRRSNDRDATAVLVKTRLSQALRSMAGNIDLTVAAGPHRLELTLQSDVDREAVAEALLAQDPIGSIADVQQPPLPFEVHDTHR